MSNQNNSTSGGIGSTGTLVIILITLNIILITLKLCNVIECSWWWILSPIWVSFGLVLFVLAIFVISDLAATLLSGPKKTKRW